MIFRKLRRFPLFQNSEKNLATDLYAVTGVAGLPLPVGTLFYIEPKYEYINPLAEEERRFAAYVERLRESFREMVREEVNKMLAASCDTPEQLARVAESVGYPIVKSE